MGGGGGGGGGAGKEGVWRNLQIPMNQTTRISNSPWDQLVKLEVNLFQFRRRTRKGGRRRTYNTRLC